MSCDNCRVAIDAAYSRGRIDRGVELLIEEAEAEGVALVAALESTAPSAEAKLLAVALVVSAGIVAILPNLAGLFG
jgi:LDH2 family malate/lactate/ureidoglycolate dehydrogenase